MAGVFRLNTFGGPDLCGKVRAFAALRPHFTPGGYNRLIQVRVLGRPRRLFYGWVVVASGFVNQALASGLGFQGFGTFIIPLEAEFGWSKATLTGARALMQLENGLLGPVEGFLIDKLGPRFTMTAGVLLFGLGLVLLGFIQSLWAYFAVFALIATGTSVGGFLVMSTSVNFWFRRKRTMALSLAQTGLGFGGILLIPLLVWAQDAFGWRGAAIAGGLLVWVIGIPMAQLLRHSPERYGALPDGDPPSEPQQPRALDAGDRPTEAGGLIDFTLGEAVRTRAFWMLGLGHGLSVMAVMGVVVNQFPHMEQGMGLARSSAALVVTVLSAMNIVGRLLGGYLGDRFDKRYMAAVGTVGASVSLVILATANSLGQAMIFGVVMGLSWGIRGPMMSSIRGEYFGRASFGKIAGTSSLLVMPGSVVGPVLAAFLADVQGDYQMGFIILAAISGVGVLAFLLATPPPPPGRLRRSITPWTGDGARPSEAEAVSGAGG